MKTKSWIILFTAIVLVLAALWLLLPKSQGALVGVYVDGELTKTLPLDTDAHYTAQTKYGRNEIIVEGGAVYVSEADCPDKTCVKHGKLAQGGVPIICLPHRLELRLIDTPAQVDAVTGGA